MSFLTYPERKALEKVRNEGIQQGRKQGKINGLLKAIQSVLEVKFEHVPESIRNALVKMQSLEKLEELLHQAKLAESLTAFETLLHKEIK